MQNLLELLHDYRALTARHTSLDSSEQTQLHALRHLLGGLPWPDVQREQEPRSTRRAAAFPLRFTVPGGFSRGEVRRLGGGGVLVGTRAKPPMGARSLVCFDVNETSYVFPAVVARKERGRFGAIGFVFDGEPERTSPDGLWRARLPLVSTQQPLVA